MFTLLSLEGKVSCAPTGALKEDPGHPVWTSASRKRPHSCLYPRPRCSDVKKKSALLSLTSLPVTKECAGVAAILKADMDAFDEVFVYYKRKEELSSPPGAPRYYRSFTEVM